MKPSRLAQTALIGLGLAFVIEQSVAAEPENLASRAKVSASSEYNPVFAVRFAVDGKVPEAETREDDASFTFAARFWEDAQAGLATNSISPVTTTYRTSLTSLQERSASGRVPPETRVIQFGNLL